MLTKLEFQEKVSRIKGDVIGKVSQIELMMSYIMANYISSKDINRLMFLFNKVSTRHKMPVFHEIITSHLRLKQHTYKDLRKDIETLQERRNILAHSMIITPNKKNLGNEKTLVFQCSNKLNVFEFRYELSDYESDMDKYSLISKSLSKIHKEIETFL